MSIFCLKKIEQPLRVGNILKKERKHQKLSIDKVSKFSRIPKHYLLAIEKNQINNLPTAKAHCLAYVKKYSDILKLATPQIAKQFVEEAGLENYTPIHPRKNLKIGSVNSILLWLKKIVIIGSVLCFIGYLVWQINGILKAPKLIVYTPIDGYLNSGLTTIVQGQTEKEVTLTINGEQIQITDKGMFETEIDLSKGLNTITISATKKHGKTTTLTRNIIAKTK